jgi:hypothetical protein
MVAWYTLESILLHQILTIEAKKSYKQINNYAPKPEMLGET